VVREAHLETFKDTGGWRRLEETSVVSNDKNIPNKTNFKGGEGDDEGSPYVGGRLSEIWLTKFMKLGTGIY